MLTTDEWPAWHRGRMTVRAAWPLLIWLGLMPLTSCMHVVSQTTPYYKDGPTQLAGPQGDLSEGTHVWVVGKDGTYARVWTLDGMDAYIWDRALMSFWDWNQKQAAEKKQAEEARKAQESDS